MHGSDSRCSPTAARGMVRHCGRCRRSPTREPACRSARRASSIRKGSDCVAEPGTSNARAITLCEVGFARAWNLRGDATHGAFVRELERLYRGRLPSAPGTTHAAADRAMLWLGPRSWLWLAQTRDVDFTSTRDALNAVGGALFDVSASYVMWRASGTNVARVLNRMCPLDLHDSAFGPGQCAQTLLGHLGAILYRPSAAPAFLLLVPRSYAQDAWEHLCASAVEGYGIEPATPLR